MSTKVDCKVFPFVYSNTFCIVNIGCQCNDAAFLNGCNRFCKGSIFCTLYFKCSIFYSRFSHILCSNYLIDRSIRRGIGRTVFKEEFQIQQVVELCFFYQQLFLFGQRVVGCSGCLHLCQQSVCVGVLGQAVKQRQIV